MITINTLHICQVHDDMKLTFALASSEMTIKYKLCFSHQVWEGFQFPSTPGYNDWNEGKNSNYVILTVSVSTTTLLNDIIELQSFAKDKTYRAKPFKIQNIPHLKMVAAPSSNVMNRRQNSGSLPQLRLCGHLDQVATVTAVVSHLPGVCLRSINRSYIV